MLGSFEVSYLIHAMVRDKRLLLLAVLGVLIILLGGAYFWVARLLRKVKEAQQRLLELATMDDLTGVANRRYFYERFEQEVARAQRYHHPLSCLILDLDDFKKVNDNYGHLAGDRVLREIAGIIRANCRTSDLPARFGGEEFIVLLPETDLTGAASFAERLRSLIASREIPLGNGQLLQITASLGVASFTPAELGSLDSGEKLIQLADDALYQAKRDGKNRVVVAARSGLGLAAEKA